jgi:hypothetical protein
MILTPRHPSPSGSRNGAGFPIKPTPSGIPVDSGMGEGRGSYASALLRPLTVFFSGAVFRRCSAYAAYV